MLVATGHSTQQPARNKGRTPPNIHVPRVHTTDTNDDDGIWIGSKSGGCTQSIDRITRQRNVGLGGIRRVVSVLSCLRRDKEMQK
jgi:hypothetical protein